MPLASTSLRVAGDAVDAEIVSYIRKQHGVLVGERTAEKIKHHAASAWPGVRDLNRCVKFAKIREFSQLTHPHTKVGS